jgi:hypothetical protein
MDVATAMKLHSFGLVFPATPDSETNNVVP